MTNERYTKTHEWARANTDGTVTVGISKYAQEHLGDVVFVELPAVGKKLGAGDEAAVVESVKAASSIYAPVAGTVAAVNDKLADAPQTINEDPVGDGWLFTLAIDNQSALNELFDATGYKNYIESA